MTIKHHHHNEAEKSENGSELYLKKKFLCYRAYIKINITCNYKKVIFKKLCNFVSLFSKLYRKLADIQGKSATQSGTQPGVKGLIYMIYAFTHSTHAPPIVM